VFGRKEAVGHSTLLVLGYIVIVVRPYPLSVTRTGENCILTYSEYSLVGLNKLLEGRRWGAPAGKPPC
jgi:hypothetical protein